MQVEEMRTLQVQIQEARKRELDKIKLAKD